MRFGPSIFEDDPTELSGEGRLQIAAFEISKGAPAPGTRVRVTEHGNNENTIEELMTDASGQTDVISLPTPPVEFSQDPERPRPFSLYDVVFEQSGFETVIVEGVQVFPDSTAFQNASMRPLPSGETTIDVITIPYPVLWGDFPPKTPEEEVKPLPPPQGLVVLPEPVVPEYIIVHAGVPSDATAPNYWVPFRDYIKNVASCEIYSTWPEATITANVLAIISFTLNRVFTEWYRGKGYNFTITNSTAYDHAFSYGRNIFQSISDVVDGIFSTYITREGIRQPLLAQYCDGRSVQCPGWMTQWGSKQLGEEGYNAVNILRNFYGQEIFLMQAKKVAGVPMSFGGVVLQAGSTGPDVRTIQQQLNTISNNYPAIRPMRVDGIFGQQTREAVETFQQVFRMPITGAVDFGTWYAISDVYVAVTRMAELR